MTKQITAPDSRIVQFCSLIANGIEAWTKAGKLLCEMKRDNSDVFLLIKIERPELTLEVLETFERIGSKQIYPYLVADSSPGARRLMALPYKEQSKIYRDGVLLVSKSGVGFSQEIKKVSLLSPAEAGRVFDGDRIRSEKEQTEILRHRRRLVESVTRSTEAGESEPSLKADLNAEPIAELSRLLTLANDIMIECRSLLAIAKRESKKDVHITNALIEIGSLRFAVNENEL
jgi:hypothetical protein